MNQKQEAQSQHKERTSFIFLLLHIYLVGTFILDQSTYNKNKPMKTQSRNQEESSK